jgi:RNA polymerase sigma-70 factor (ECF subfamily)
MPERRPAVADPLSLHLLVLRCQAGDDRAFGKLMETFSSRTLGYLRGLVGEDADDVHQEVWLSVYRGIGGLANPRAFHTWLFQTTRHRAVDFLRRRKRDRELLEDVAGEVVVDTKAAESDVDLAGVDEPALDAALMAIPPPQREVLLLRYRDDLPYAEIAIIVGCPIGTVRTRLHHAKRRLQELLTRGHP